MICEIELTYLAFRILQVLGIFKRLFVKRILMFRLVLSLRAVWCFSVCSSIYKTNRQVEQKKVMSKKNAVKLFQQSAAWVLLSFVHPTSFPVP